MIMLMIVMMSSWLERVWTWGTHEYSKKQLPGLIGRASPPSHHHHHHHHENDDHHHDYENDDHHEDDILVLENCCPSVCVFCVWYQKNGAS